MEATGSAERVVKWVRKAQWQSFLLIKEERDREGRLEVASSNPQHWLALHTTLHARRCPSSTLPAPLTHSYLAHWAEVWPASNHSYESTLSSYTAKPASECV